MVSYSTNIKRVQTKQEINDRNKEYLKKVGINKIFFDTIVRPRILEKYDNKCSKCGKEHKRMHIHHKSYEFQNINTLIPLCPGCHKKLHNKLKKESKDI